MGGREVCGIYAGGGASTAQWAIGGGGGVARIVQYRCISNIRYYGGREGGGGAGGPSHPYIGGPPQLKENSLPPHPPTIEPFSELFNSYHNLGITILYVEIIILN